MHTRCVVAMGKIEASIKITDCLTRPWIIICGGMETSYYLIPDEYNWAMRKLSLHASFSNFSLIWLLLFIFPCPVINIILILDPTVKVTRNYILWKVEGNLFNIDNKIQIFDVYGKLVLSDSEVSFESENSFKIDLSSYNKGIYFIKIGEEYYKILKE